MLAPRSASAGEPRQKQDRWELDLSGYRANAEQGHRSIRKPSAGAASGYPRTFERYLRDTSLRKAQLVATDGTRWITQGEGATMHLCRS